MDLTGVRQALPVEKQGRVFRILAFQNNHMPPVSDDKESAKQISSPSATFPDGGSKAWLVVLGAWCCMFTSFGWITCIGVFQDFYQRELLSEYSASAVAWIPSTETFIMFVGAPVFGKLFDSYGPMFSLLLGTALHVFGLMMVSVSTEYYQVFLSQSICSAIGTSAIFWASNNSVGTWFRRRRALAFGIVSSGSSVGGVVGTVMIPNLVNRIGFAWTMRVVAFMYLALLIIAIFTVQSRLKHTPSRFRLSDLFRPIHELSVSLLALASFLSFLGIFLPYNFLVLQAVHSGMSSRLAGYLLVILSATSIFGRIVPGWLGDRYGCFNVMISTSYLSSLLVLALWIPAQTNATNIVFAALYGFSSGTFVAMVPTLIAQVCSDISRLGEYMGVTYLVISPAVLVCQPIAGALLAEDDGGYMPLQVFCGVALFLGATFFIASRSVNNRAIKGNHC